MTSERRFDQDLPDLLAQVAQAPAPDYRDLIVQRTARTRQRPAWTFPERWLPMSAVTSRAAIAPRFPLRIVGVVALLLIALLVGAVLFAGSQRHLPAPFGLAAAGRLAYAANGDIYSADPVTGAKTAIVTGPETDVHPVWSLDGTRVVFERKVYGDTGDGRLFVARADGTGLVAITPDPQSLLASYAFSPDGTEVAFMAGPTASFRALDREDRRERRSTDRCRHERLRAMVPTQRRSRAHLRRQPGDGHREWDLRGFPLDRRRPNDRGAVRRHRDRSHHRRTRWISRRLLRSDRRFRWKLVPRHGDRDRRFRDRHHADARRSDLPGRRGVVERQQQHRARSWVRTTQRGDDAGRPPGRADRVALARRPHEG